MVATASLFLWGAGCGQAEYNCSHPDIVNAAKDLYLKRFTGIELLKRAEGEAKSAADTLRSSYRANTKLREIWVVKKNEHAYTCQAIVETPQLLSKCAGNNDASSPCSEQKRRFPTQVQHLLTGVSMAHEENSLLYIIAATGDGGFFMHGWKLKTIIADGSGSN